MRAVPVLSVLVTVPFLAVGCIDDRNEGEASAGSDSVTGAGSRTHASRCFRLPHSVLLGPPTATGQQGHGPGWIHFEQFGADSGNGALVDGNRAGLATSWRRTVADSISLAAFDDFLRVEMMLAASDSLLEGIASSVSDAALERDSTGRLRDLERRWPVRASLATCDSLPERGTPR